VINFGQNFPSRVARRFAKFHKLPSSNCGNENQGSSTEIQHLTPFPTVNITTIIYQSLIVSSHKLGKMSSFIQTVADKIPNAALVIFGAIGFLFIGGKVFNYVRMLFSLFVLSGKNVRYLNPTFMITIC
jgi:heme/copper-type cytochrome/quinol oxidase subunit 3